MSESLFPWKCCYRGAVVRSDDVMLMALAENLPSALLLSGPALAAP
jgi:hypothetical protein